MPYSLFPVIVRIQSLYLGRASTSSPGVRGLGFTHKKKQVWVGDGPTQPFSFCVYYPGYLNALFSLFFQCGYKVYIGPRKYFVTSDVGDGLTQPFLSVSFWCVLPLDI